MNIHKTDISSLKNAEDMPKTLIVQGGELYAIDGSTPFLDLPDGTLVHVVERPDMLKILEERIHRRDAKADPENARRFVVKKSRKRIPAKKVAKKKAAKKVTRKAGKSSDQENR